MDINKEREAFESAMQELSGGQTKNDVNPVTGEYQYGVMQVMWSVWQKAQAVPEGFKVVSFKQISELVVAVNKVDLMTHTEQKTNEVRLAWQDIASKMQAMIEAQEQPK